MQRRTTDMLLRRFDPLAWYAAACSRADGEAGYGVSIVGSGDLDTLTRMAEALKVPVTGHTAPDARNACPAPSAASAEPRPERVSPPARG